MIHAGLEGTQVGLGSAVDDGVAKYQGWEAFPKPRANVLFTLLLCGFAVSSCQGVGMTACVTSHS